MSEGKPSNDDSAGLTADQTAVTQTPTPVSDRSELVSRARLFLQSPQISEQSNTAKRQFLIDKGLNDSEVDALLQELPLQRPTIPPRTYPQPPPSHLPTLILGITRIFSWLAGGSAVIIFLYYRFLLPRITQTALARKSLKAHHLSLLGRLNDSLNSLKQLQAESYSVLPSPDPSQETNIYQVCHSISDVLKILGSEAPGSIPPITLLRCALEGFGKGKEGDTSQPTTDDLFRYMEGQIPWLVSDEGQKYEQTLWNTLSTCSLFSDTSSTTTDTDDQKPARWTYITPLPAEPSPIMQSMKRLTLSLPKNSEPKTNPRQHTLQALSDFTGYISTQIYMPYQAPSSAAGFLNGNSSIGAAEEEFKRDIRALKGLVLNRRSFMSPTPRPNFPTP